ncbi:hypothetical protein OHAE_46 [Ochrobactrum soli]|uniref:Uncharacterized protein n=1 Tax=Ochrobactrum soli TaxID=2448455 RepID=A0A2P9HJC9_9HYPH|nr:hypothetical protein OHAE_46 [[Ochrobactrum] soli]
MSFHPAPMRSENLKPAAGTIPGQTLQFFRSHQSDFVSVWL